MHTTGDNADAPDASSVLRSLADASSAQMGEENFPVALRMLPPAARRKLAAVYRFARFVDDVGDEAPGGPEVRLELLDLVERDLLLLGHGTPTLRPVADLAAVTARHDIPVTTYLDLVQANRQDQTVTRYETFDDLLDYCRLSAAPIGRIVLHVAGRATEANIADSDSVCAALQVLEHCQDVGEDARRDRVYLPAAELREHGVADRELRAAGTSPGLREVVGNQVERADAMLTRGNQLLHDLTGWPRAAVSGYIAGGVATAYALRARRFEVLATDVKPSKARIAGLTARYWAGR